jgi:DNA-binding NarL/FixJ family response regulator
MGCAGVAVAKEMKTYVVVEDDDELRVGLVKFFNSRAEMQCVGSFASGMEALSGIPLCTPDVVLLDESMPDMHVTECVSRLKMSLPSAPVVILTNYENNGRLLETWRAGALTFAFKLDLLEVLNTALRIVNMGDSVVAVPILSNKPGPARSDNSLKDKFDELTPREMEVLMLVASGLLYKEIGDKLVISPATVRIHVKNTCKKLGVMTRIEALAKLHELEKQDQKRFP